jgi:PAS domain S-box-containing protein
MGKRRREPDTPATRSAWPPGGGEVGRLIRTRNWEHTSLGDTSAWSSSLRWATELVLSSTIPRAILWGVDLLQIYNDSYCATFMHGLHPTALGQPTRESWPEVFSRYEPYYARVLGGESLVVDDLLIPVQRDGHPADVWMTLACTPLRDDSDTVAGIFISAFETTKSHLDGVALRVSEERQTFLLRLSDALRPLQNAEEIKSIAARILGEHLRVDHVYYSEVEFDEVYIVTSLNYYSSGVGPDIVGRVRFADYSRWVFDELQAAHHVAVRDVQEETRFSEAERAGYAAVQLQSFVACPLVKSGKLAAILGVTQAAPRAWTHENLAIIEETAERTWSAVERAIAEAALRESEERFRTFVDLVPDLLWRRDMRGAVTWYNQRWIEYTGQAFAETHDTNGLDFIHPDDREALMANYHAATEAGRPFLSEHRIRRADGTYRWFLTHAEPVHDADGQIVQWFGAATDVQERRAEHEELAERVAESTAQLRALSRQLIRIQEEERRHLARELHDEIGQVLTGLQFQLASALRKGTLDSQGLAEAETIVRDLTRRVSALSMDLRPAVLDALGLLPALLWHVERFKTRTGVTVRLRHQGIERRFAPAVEITAYRVIQEALTNVARHAEARTATIHLLADDAVLTLAIRDDGVGIAASKVMSATGGLGGLRERVALLGGSVDIESEPGVGTSITCELPLQESESAEPEAQP